MEPAGFDVDELIEFWTLLDEDRDLLVGKRGATALGFALLLKHYSRYGRFPRGRSEVPDEVIAFVARQLGVAAVDLGFYEWAGSTIEYHRAQVRDHLGYRLATVADQETLTGWLSEAVAQAERSWPSSGGCGSSHRQLAGCFGWFARRCAQRSGTGPGCSP